MTIVLVAIAVVTLPIVVLLGLRWMDAHRDKTTWRDLTIKAGGSTGRYDPHIVRDLPEPAQRYFNYSIAAGAPLVPAVELVMRGELGLGSIEHPRYAPMRARQILAPPHGLVWRVRAGSIGGSDGAIDRRSWTRFWLFGFIPIVRVGGDEDHYRSAFGRVIAEGAFWTPAMLLPGNHVRWEAVDENTARATVARGSFDQVVDLTVAADGQPQHVVISRWSNENAERAYRLQPFGGYLRDFREFEGYRLPTVVEGGNHFGTDRYFPFFKAKVTELRHLGVSR